MRTMISSLTAACNSFAGRYPAHARIVRFVVSGGTATFINVAVVYIFTEWVGLWYLASGVIAFFSAIATSFFLQKLWTFEDASTNRMPLQAGVFFLIACWGLVVNVVVVYALVEYVSTHYVLAQLVAGIVIAIQNYLAYALLFKRS
jgi:dolichol-phosphate mannosyltransferase